MTAISLFNQLPSTKNEIDNFCERVKNTILAGNDNPLTIAVQLKAIEEVVKKLRTDKEVQACIEDELSRNGNKLSWAGAELQLRNSVSYKYETDAEWSALNAELDVLKAKMKGREEYLKRVKIDMVDEKTGEIIPPIETVNKVSIVVNLK